MQKNSGPKSVGVTKIDACFCDKLTNAPCFLLRIRTRKGILQQDHGAFCAYLTKNVAKSALSTLRNEYCISKLFTVIIVTLNPCGRAKRLCFGAKRVIICPQTKASE